MDTERAVAKMRELAAAAQEKADLADRRRRADPRGYLHDPEWEAAKTELDRALEPCVRIANAVDPAFGSTLRKAATSSPETVVSICDRVIGALQSSAEIDDILGPAGPKLAAAQLHPWVWNAAVDLWSDGHHREALQAAATAVFDGHLPAKLGIEAKPADLVGIAFSLDAPALGKPRLRIPGYDEGTASWKDVHEGARYIGIGCAKVRNLSTHELEQEEGRALEQLACLSVFARWAAEADLVQV